MDNEVTDFHALEARQVRRFVVAVHPDVPSIRNGPARVGGDELGTRRDPPFEPLKHMTERSLRVATEALRPHEHH